MEILFNVLMIVIPAGIVFLMAYFAINKFLDNEQKKRLLDFKREGQKEIITIRLQAYERLTMYLERISPEILINRIHKSGMSARMLQAELVEAIRSEFNHNLSQQVYISNASWTLIKNGKEEMIKMINMASSKLKNEASGTDLSKLILQINIRLEKPPTQAAIDFLKKEVRQTF